MTEPNPYVPARWIDTGSGPGWSPEDDQGDNSPDLGTAWEMHDDPEIDLPEVPD
jgi:hypothetical protein